MFIDPNLPGQQAGDDNSAAGTQEGSAEGTNETTTDVGAADEGE